MKQSRYRSLLLATVVMAVMLSLAFVLQEYTTSQVAADTGSGRETPASRDQVADFNTPNCRYGVVASGGAQQASAVPVLAAGWYFTYGNREKAPLPANGAEFAHLFRTRQDKTQQGDYLPTYTVKPPLSDAIGRLIARNPGALWVVGDEVDRGPDPGQTQSKQGDTFAEVYARAYYEVYHFIKEHDPTARVAISGLVEVTPGRLAYLDQVWASYQEQFGQTMTVDVFNMHLYILPEVTIVGGVKVPNAIASVALGTDPDLGIASSQGDPSACADAGVYCMAEHDNMTAFAQQVRAMRQWLKDHGQQDKPLIITEYSQLYPYNEAPDDSCSPQDENGQCFTPERVRQFMLNSFDYLESAADPDLGYWLDDDRLIQQWLWYSVNTVGEGSVSNLTESDLQTLTPLGQTFRDRATGQSQSVNLIVAEVPSVAATTAGGGMADVALSAVFRSSGNRTIDIPIDVTFYSDPDRNVEIGRAMVEAPIGGCAMQAYTASVSWAGLAPGHYPFWAFVDSNNAVDEGGQESDNLGQGEVWVTSDRVFLPILRRP